MQQLQLVEHQHQPSPGWVASHQWLPLGQRGVERRVSGPAGGGANDIMVATDAGRAGAGGDAVGVPDGAARGGGHAFAGIAISAA